MKIHIHSYSTTGNVRADNEDAVLVDEALGLFAVADGMGGRASGEVAASLALRATQDFIRRAAESKGLANLSAVVVQRAIEHACATVHEEAQRNREHRGMGTTLTVLMLAKDHAIVGHVGDSRLYRVRDDQPHQLTADHSLGAELERSGVSANGDAFSHILTRSVGSHASVVVDTLTLPAGGADAYILVTDGAHEGVGGERFAEHLRADNPARAIVDRALALGTHDNASAVVLRMERDAKESERPIEDLLRGIGPLSSLSEMNLLLLREAGHRREVDAGECVWEAGQAVDEMIVVLRGTLAWISPPAGWAPISVEQAVGLSTLLKPRAAPARLEASESTLLFVLSSKALRALVRRRHAVGVAVLLRLGAALTDRLEPAGAQTPW